MTPEEKNLDEIERTCKHIRDLLPFAAETIDAVRPGYTDEIVKAIESVRSFVRERREGATQT